MALEVRRIVTGHDANGKAIVKIDERLQAVGSEIRADGEGVGFDAAGREERLGVALRADVDVAALGVRDDQQAGRAGVLDGRSERVPARHAEALEACDLGLDRDARGARRVDHRAAVGGDVGAGLRPELRRVGIEPQDDLGLAAGDEARQPVAEGRPGRGQVGWRGAGDRRAVSR